MSEIRREDCVKRIALHKLETMTESETAPVTGFAAFIRSEYPLFVGLVTAAIFLALGNQAVEDVSHPYAMAAVFVWLFVGVLWSAISVVRHADCLALKCGEYLSYWDGKYLDGKREATPGVYYYQLTVDGERYTRKMIAQRKVTSQQ